VKPDLAYFGTAYSELRHGNFDRAAKAFIAMADRYPIERDSLSFALPYFAFAASKTGDELELEKYIRNHPKSDKDFDYLLAKALRSGTRPGLLLPVRRVTARSPVSCLWKMTRRCSTRSEC
jgi:hypothetical protein